MFNVWSGLGATDDPTSPDWNDIFSRGFDSLDRLFGRYGGPGGGYYPTGPDPRADVSASANISIWVWILIAIGIFAFLKRK